MTGGSRLRILVVSLGRRGGVTEYGWLMGRALAGDAEIAVIHSAFADNREKWSALNRPRLEVRTFTGYGSMLLSFLAFTRFARIQALRP